MPMRIHTWNAQRCDARGVCPAMLVPETLSQRCLMPEALSQRCLMPFLAMPDPEVLPMQRSLPSVGSLAHTTSRTTRTENPARCRLLDARLHDYTTPNTTRRPTQHDAQHNTTPDTTRRPIHRAALNGTHALRRTSADNPRFPVPRASPSTHVHCYNIRIRRPHLPPHGLPQ
jgi:hypothetical protein